MGAMTERSNGYYWVRGRNGDMTAAKEWQIAYFDVSGFYMYGSEMWFETEYMAEIGDFIPTPEKYQI